MKRRTLLTLLLAPIVSPLLGALGRVYPKRVFSDEVINRAVFPGPFKTEFAQGGFITDPQLLTLQDLSMVRAKMEKFSVPTFQGNYWFDVKRQKMMGTEDYKDLIENENLRIQKINNETIY